MSSIFHKQHYKIKMPQHSLNNNSVNLKLWVTLIYTISGVKSRYRLGDMAYGEWLIFKESKPAYYLNIFDDNYTPLREKAGDDVQSYLRNRLLSSGEDLTLTSNIIGLRIGKELEEWVTVEWLPIAFVL